MFTDVALSGNLNFLNLGELLQLFGSNGATGVLRIYSDQVPEPGEIYFEKGNPVHAQAMDNGGLHAIYSLFGWMGGSFEFFRQPVDCQKTISKSRMEIILEGLRLLDEGKIEKVEGGGAPAQQVRASAEPKLRSPALSAESGKIPVITGPLVDYSYVVDEEGFYDGDEIVQEGNHGDWIWVILEGTAEIVKQTPRGPVKIIGLSDGAFLGNMSALLSGNNVRSATVRAVGNIQLGMLDIQLLTNHLAACSPEMKAMIRSMDNRLREATSMAVAVYADPRCLASMLAGRKQVIGQGQPERRLARIRDGSALVVQQVDDALLPVAKLRPGDFFGNLPLVNIGHEPDNASIWADSGLKIQAVDPARLVQEFEELPPILRTFIEYQATCISATTMVVRNFHRQGLNGGLDSN